MERQNRQRILNAILYVAGNTNYCGKIKLFKLLYLVDFEHYSLTGRSVTGYEYQAWKFGPVPASLMEEWEELGDDLRTLVHIEPELVIDYTRMTIKANDGVKFDDSHFTPRQLKIMEDVTNKYMDEMSDKMIDVTHEQNGAWDKVWKDGAGARDTIPYELSVSDDLENDYKQYILASAEEAKGYSANLEADY